MNKKPRLLVKKKNSDRHEPVRKEKYENESPKRKHVVVKNKDGKSPKPGLKKTYSHKSGGDSLNPSSHLVRLNKYIANAGICSRRDADKLIESGLVRVNGKVVTELGSKIQPGDVVKYDNRVLHGEALRYVLLNKPKGYISTLEDPQDRKTVMELVRSACRERIYPVGRLDRNTTGLLLFTNDGDMAKKLTHPKHRVRKVYHVELSKALLKNDLLEIAAGVELEDGLITPDAIVYAGAGDDKKKIGVEIHSGKNRVVRRIFEKFDYEVEKLDRVIFANLTKKDLPRGKWRHLTPTEINILRRIQ